MWVIRPRFRAPVGTTPPRSVLATEPGRWRTRCRYALFGEALVMAREQGDLLRHSAPPTFTGTADVTVTLSEDGWRLDPSGSGSSEGILLGIEIRRRVRSLPGFA